MRARHVVLALVTVVVFAASASAQSTTGVLRCTVKSAEDSQPMAEAEVTLVHEPTGSEKSAVTNASGEVVFTGLRVGGPYHVTAAFTGFKAAEAKGIFLSANKTTDVELPLALQEEVIEVKSNAVPRNTSGRQTISSEEIAALPSINRDPKDMVRRTPEVTVKGSSMSFGGMNPRFNSITIDGLRMDDDFGLNSSGYPTNRPPIPLSAVEELDVEQTPFDVRYDKFLGGNVNIITKSGTNDVHGEFFGTFSNDHLIGHHIGGDDPTNPSHFDLPSTIQFHEYRYGGEIAGPILKDKIHFVVAADFFDGTTFDSVGPAGSGAANIVSRVSQADLAAVTAAAQSVYGFNPGGTSQNLDEGNYNLFAKVDYDIDQYNRVVGTFLRNDGNQIASAGSTFFRLPLTSQWYNSLATLNSGSLRWFSDVTDELSTEVSVAGKTVQNHVPSLCPPPPSGGPAACDFRDPNQFMSATINTPGGGQILLGPDVFRHANELDNDLLQVRALANYLAGRHLVTAGIEYELLHIHNLFIPFSNTSATFASPADFMNQNPSDVFLQASTTGNPEDAAASFNTGTLAPFIQDQIKLTSALTITGGVRFEVYKADNNIVGNSTFAQRYSQGVYDITQQSFVSPNLTNTGTLDGKFLIMPRLGVSWLVTDRLNLRAGGGLYSGGTPTVWMSNNYTNDGVRIGVADDTNALDIQGYDGRHFPAGLTNMIKPGNGNVDSLDPRFQLPSAWKVGTGADWDIPDLGMLKLNYVYTQVQNGVYWVDLRRCNTNGITDQTNLNRTGMAQSVCSTIPDSAPLGQLPDGRYYYDTTPGAGNGFNNFIGYDMMLSNKDGYGRNVGGYGHNASLLLSHGFSWGLFLAGAYAYQNVVEATPANSSISSSNYKFYPVFDPNYADLARSAYETTHRFTATAEFSYPLLSHFTDSPWLKYMKTSFGIFAETYSGQPYSWTFGDSSAGAALSKLYGEDKSIASVDRMLFYVPSTTCINSSFADPACEVELNGIDPGKFNSFLHKTGLDHYAGAVSPRNAFEGDWISRIDLRFSQDLPNPFAPRHRAKFMMDIQNFGNMLDHQWGRVTFVPFPYVAPAVDAAYDPVAKKYVYSNLRDSSQTRVDVLASVWKMSIGLMYDF